MGAHPRPPFDLAAGAEQRDRRRAHRRGDMHRRRIDADKRLGARGQGREFGQAELSGEIGRRAGDASKNRVDHRLLARIRRSGENNAFAFADQPVDQFGDLRGRPALEQPARSRMQLNEAATGQSVGAQQGVGPRVGFGAGNQHQPFRCVFGMQAEPPQSVQIEFHRVPSRTARQRVEVRERCAPQPRRIPSHRRDAVADSQQSPQPGAARMFGQMDEKIVLTIAQRAQQARLAAQLRQRTVPLPFPIHCEQLADRRMVSQHRECFAINERIDLDLRRMRFQRREHGRGEQHVAMMTKLGDQHAAHGGKIDGVGDHGQNDSKLRSG